MPCVGRIPSFTGGLVLARPQADHRNGEIDRSSTTGVLIVGKWYRPRDRLRPTAATDNRSQDLASLALLAA